MNLLAPVVASGPSANVHPFFESVQRAITRGPQAEEIYGLLVGVLAFLLLTLIASRVFGRRHGVRPRPRIDYLTLAVDVLGLSEAERRDLQRIARQAGLDQPASLLLTPANLARAARPVLATDQSGELRKRLEQLSLRLFNAPLPDPERAGDRSAT